MLALLIACILEPGSVWGSTVLNILRRSASRSSFCCYIRDFWIVSKSPLVLEIRLSTLDFSKRFWCWLFISSSFTYVFIGESSGFLKLIFLGMMWYWRSLTKVSKQEFSAVFEYIGYSDLLKPTFPSNLVREIVLGSTGLWCLLNPSLDLPIRTLLASFFSFSSNSF